MGLLAFIALIFMDRVDDHHTMKRASREDVRMKKDYNITYFWER